MCKLYVSCIHTYYIIIYYTILLFFYDITICKSDDVFRKMQAKEGNAVQVPSSRVDKCHRTNECSQCREEKRGREKERERSQHMTQAEVQTKKMVSTKKRKKRNTGHSKSSKFTQFLFGFMFSSRPFSSLSLLVFACFFACFTYRRAPRSASLPFTGPQRRSPPWRAPAPRPPSRRGG